MSYYKLLLQHTPQTEWADQGFLLEMTFGAVGGGLFLAGAAGGSLWVCLLGFLLATACKGFLLLKDLGRPERCLKVLMRPFSSWLSFGAWGLGLFGLSGLFHLAAMFRAGADLWSLTGVPAAFFALVVVAYDGFLMGASKAIAAWNSGTLVPLFAANAVACGCAFMAAVHPASWFSTAAFAMLLAELLILAAHVAAMRGGSTGMRATFDILTRGQERKPFLGGAAGIGIILPLFIFAAQSAGGTAHEASFALSSLAGAAMTVYGVFCLRASLLRSGVTTPVL